MKKKYDFKNGIQGKYVGKLTSTLITSMEAMGDNSKTETAERLRKAREVAAQFCTRHWAKKNFDDKCYTCTQNLNCYLAGMAAGEVITAKSVQADYAKYLKTARKLGKAKKTLQRIAGYDRTFPHVLSGEVPPALQAVTKELHKTLKLLES